MNTGSLFSNHSEEAFLQLALETFRRQARECAVYRHYVELLSVQVDRVTSLEDIPFLPIDFFKKHIITTGELVAEKVFSSSGTTGTINSKHYVKDLSLYEQSYRQAFQEFYGPAEQYAILALLPSYLERSGSSLIYMVDDLIKQSGHKQSGYFLYNHQELHTQLLALKSKRVPTILFGVTYALLDFIENFHISFPELIVMETGGMKGRRKEIIRSELHALLTEGFGVQQIHSEYGMTELLSQAYSAGQGRFRTPGWMKIMIREINDPFAYRKNQQTGGVNVIDLANQHSCSFLATQDLGKQFNDGSFEILGRFDQSDLRGCNLMVE